MIGTVPADRQDNFAARTGRLCFKIAMIAPGFFGAVAGYCLKTLRVRAVPGCIFLLVAACAADGIKARPAFFCKGRAAPVKVCHGRDLP